MHKQKSNFYLVESTLPSFQREIGLKKVQTDQDCIQGSINSEQKQINMELYKRFQNFLQNQKLFKLQKIFKKHCGRHYPINYKTQFGFTQYWQDTKSKFDQANILQYFQYPRLVFYVFALFILLSKLSITWTISVHRLFQMDTKNQQKIIILGLFTMFADIIFQYQVFQHYDYLKDKKLKKCIKSFWKHILAILYFITLPLYNKDYSHQFLLIDLFIASLISIRILEIWKTFRLQVNSTKYKNSFKVTELFATLLPIAHVFALLLYFVAALNVQQNWMSTRNLQNHNPLDKYIYSLYFVLTTMLTVGYGDISPVNIPEIIVIMIIQIIGIVTYGYIINQIGHIISQIRLQDQILFRDIACMSKMAKYYKLNKNLVEKAKNYLVSRKKQHTHLTPQQEDSTLKKLHDQLRQQISQQNALKIVKSSLFYVCNWTKRFQIEIAKKLHKKIYTPNEEILQIPGKQRLYVFKKGKVEIHANRISGYKKHFKKILRTIEANETMEVSDNIYGYTFLLSNTPIKLTAINKEFVVAYFVEKKDFLETVMDNHLDEEYFFQMKTKIDSMSYPESWEAPLIINTKEHYFPNIQYLIMKNKLASEKQKNGRSSRFYTNRFKNRSKRIFYRNYEEMQAEVCPILEMIDPIINLTHQLENRTFTSEKVLPTTVTLQMNSLPNLKFHSGVLQQEGVFRKDCLHYMFEQGRQYINFFKRFNCSSILFKLQNSNFMLKPKRSWKSIRSSSGRLRRSKSKDHLFQYY